MDINGMVSGEIDVAFDYSSPGMPSYGLAGWQGLVEGLEVDAGAQRMIFDFWSNGGYGPVSFDLWRCNE